MEGDETVLKLKNLKYIYSYREANLIKSNQEHSNSSKFYRVLNHEKSHFYSHIFETANNRNSYQED